MTAQQAKDNFRHYLIDALIVSAVAAAGCLAVSCAPFQDPAVASYVQTNRQIQKAATPMVQEYGRNHPEAGADVERLLSAWQTMQTAAEAATQPSK